MAEPEFYLPIKFGKGTLANQRPDPAQSQNQGSRHAGSHGRAQSLPDPTTGAVARLQVSMRPALP